MSIVSIRLPENLTKALARLAETTERSKTFIIRRAIESYMTDYADYQIALDRLNDKDDPILSSVEMKKRLG